MIVPHTTQLQAELHLDEAYQQLRSSLVNVAVLARGKPTFPQDLARHLKINKNLAWHISKVIKAPTPSEGIPHLPGASGLKLFLRAAEIAGADADSILQVQRSHEAYLEAVKIHAGDQETLDLLLDGPVGGNMLDALSASRRMAFLGNSGLSGVQARAKITACMIAPSSTRSDLLDALLIGGFVDLCRLRQVEGIPLFRVLSYHADGQPIEPPERPVVWYENDGVFTEVASESISDLTVVQHDKGQTYRLAPGRVGRTGAFSAFFAKEVNGQFSRYATEGEPRGEFFSLVAVPVQTLLFDLFIHRDLDFGRDIEFSILSRPARGLDDHLAADKRERLPITVKPARLPGSDFGFVTDVYAHYPDLIRSATASYGSLADFACYRYIVEYPPLHSTVMLSFPLDERPAG